MVRWPLRLTILCMGTFALVWSAYCVITLIEQAPLESAARRVLAREPYQLSALTAISVEAGEKDSKWKRPSHRGARAVVDLRLLELATALADTQSLDGRFLDTEVAIKAALSVAPANAFLWTVYFWVENNRFGFAPAHLSYLRMSYRTGPNEGWVAVTRNRIGLALYSVLPSDIAIFTVFEFSHLVGSGYFDAAIESLSLQREPLLSRLLGSLEAIDPRIREAFAKGAYRRGYDWELPGVERREWRPWH